MLRTRVYAALQETVRFYIFEYNCVRTCCRTPEFNWHAHSYNCFFFFSYYYSSGLQLKRFDFSIFAFIMIFSTGLKYSHIVKPERLFCVQRTPVPIKKRKHNRLRFLTDVRFCRIEFRFPGFHKNLSE